MPRYGRMVGFACVSMLCARMAAAADALLLYLPFDGGPQAALSSGAPGLLPSATGWLTRRACAGSARASTRTAATLRGATSALTPARSRSGFGRSGTATRKGATRFSVCMAIVRSKSHG